LLGDYLGSVFNTGYTWAIADAFAILLGLLFTFGIQVEESWEVLRTAFFGALGFAVGNFLADPAISGALFPVEIFPPISFTLWGLIGGAILEAPSRTARQILFTAGICGIGLLAGYYTFLVVFPAVGGQSYLVEFPDRYHVLRNVILGIGLGLALGLLIRRASAIGVLAVLGAGIYMITRALNADVFTFPDIWKAVVRGALIGLVLGYGYGYMRKAEPSLDKPHLVVIKPIWIGIIGLLTVGVIAAVTALLGPDNYVDTPRVSALTSSTVDLIVWAPQNAIDGDVNTAWSSNGYDKPANTEWFVVDMGTPQKLARIRVVPRDVGYGFPLDFKFQTSNDGTIWTDIPGQSYIGYPNPGSMEQVFTFTAVTARYLRMYATRLRPDDYSTYYFQLEDIYPQRVAR